MLVFLGRPSKFVDAPEAVDLALHDRTVFAFDLQSRDQFPLVDEKTFRAIRCEFQFVGYADPIPQ